MSSTRNKRKRPEIDASSMAHASRRRSRETRAIVAESESMDQKSEHIQAESNPRELLLQSSRASSSSPPQNKDLDAVADSVANDIASNSLNSITKRPHAALGGDDSDAGSSEETSIPRQALHATIKEESKEASRTVISIEIERASRIRGLISHRSLLLSRVKLCRNAADKRLEETRVVAVMGKNGKGASYVSEITDEIEIQAHKDMTKVALQTAKKNRSDNAEGTAEKRTSLSLRRGSSVGKRMNAALSSLAPGITASGTGHENTIPVSGQTQFSAGKSYHKGQPASIHKSLSGHLMPTEAISDAVITQNFSAATKKQTKNNLGESLVPTKHSAVSSEQKSRPPNSKLLKTNSSSVSRSRSESIGFRPGHNLPEIQSNLLSQAKTFFPEAAKLRDRRKSVEASLRAILNSQKVRTGGNRHDSSSAIKQTARLDVDELEGVPSISLPRRRTTHWDRLLDEMSWLATDFIEERKWKISLARTVSSSMSLHGTSSAALKGGKGHHKIIQNRNHGNLSVGGKIKDSTNDEEQLGALSKQMKSEEVKKYIDLSSDDDASAKKAAKETSNIMIAFISTGRRELLSFQKSDMDQKVSSQHHDEDETSDTGLVRHGLDEIDCSLGLKVEDSRRQIGVTAKDTIEEGVKSQKSKMNIAEQLSFSDIGKRIQGLTRSNSKVRSKVSWKEFAQAINSARLNLTEKQKETVEYFDRSWNLRSPGGSILLGQPSSGKTIAMCSILWKHRMHGPQLIVCPQFSLLRWKYELRRFQDLRTFMVGLSDANQATSACGQYTSILPGPCDVVICGYDSIASILGYVRKQKVEFYSMCIDIRHNDVFFESNERSIRETTSELVDLNWWHNIIALADNEEMRRVVIEYAESDVLSLSSAKLGKRQKLEILSLRAALVMGPRIFFPSPHSLQRTVISWARKQGKSIGEDKYDRVRRVLQEALQPLCFSIQSTLASFTDVAWETVRCEMPLQQREFYESCCSQVRGTLSCELYSGSADSDYGPNAIKAASLAFLRLRNACISNIDSDRYEGVQVLTRLGKLLNTDISGSTIGSPGIANGPGRKSSDSASQPDINLSASLLESSAKLTELISILWSECFYEPGETLVKEVLNTGRTRRSRASASSKNSRRVAIVASLPKIQMLVSVLLNSLGIQHDLIGISLSDGQANQACKKSIFRWIEAQRALSAFNFNENTKQSVVGQRVIVASTEFLASWHGGLGIDNADLVILMDEDWSGRGGNKLKASLSRWNSSRHLRGLPRRLLQLVCKDSIEEQICKFSEHSEENEGKGWPLDESGNHAFPSRGDLSHSLHIEDVGFCPSPFSLFPGLGFLRLRGQQLDKVLVSTKQIEPSFRSGAKILFLPVNDAGRKSEKDLELTLVRDLMRAEQREHTTMWRNFNRSDVERLGWHVDELQNASGYRAQTLLQQDWGSSIRFFFFKQLAISTSSEIHVPGIFRFPMDKKANISQPSSVATRQDENCVSAGPEMVGTWQKRCLSMRPNEWANSMLCYKSDQPSKEAIAFQASNFVAESGNRRFNAYARIYSTSWKENLIRDGSQGVEPVVFFPPLLPQMQHSRKTSSNTHFTATAKANLGNLSSTIPSNQLLPSKRKEPCDDESQSAKRARAAAPAVMKGISNQNVGTGVHGANENVCDENDNDFGLFGSGLMPLLTDCAQFLAHDPRATKMGIQIISVDENHSDSTSSSGIPELEGKSTALTRGDEGHLEVIALFVRRGPKSSLSRDGPAQLYRPQALLKQNDLNRNNSNATTRQDPFLLAHSSKLINDEDGGKKQKKKANPQGLPSAFTRLPSIDLAQKRLATKSATGIASAKDSLRHQLFATFVSRQFGTRLSMFESTAFVVARAKVQKRVASNVDKALWNSSSSLEIGPGIPLEVVHQSTSIQQGIVRYTNFTQGLRVGSVTGDAARTIATTQRTSLRRSLSAPCRVDFGPFGSGFLSAPSGMTGIAPPRSRLGVSLPMGVKIPLNTRDQAQTLWVEDDDLHLQDAAVRFGMNWMIASRILSGLEGVRGAGTQIRGNRRLPLISRSARQCRDRWQSLARSQPSLASAVRKSEKILRDNALVREGQIPGHKDPAMRLTCSKDPPGSNDLIALCGLALFNETDNSWAQPTEQQDPERDSTVATERGTTEGTQGNVVDDIVGTRTRFSALSTAKAKRQVLPLTIPGVSPTGQPNQPVPSHPSHSQSVQSSVAAQWSNGRTEMWPLQILDCADKHRLVARASSSGSQRPPDGKAGVLSSSLSRRQPVASAPPVAHRPKSTRDRSVGFPTAPSTSSRGNAHRPNSSVLPTKRNKVPTEPTASVFAKKSHGLTNKLVEKSKPQKKIT